MVVASYKRHLLRASSSSVRIIPCAHRARLLYCGSPLVMGVLNVTPDSFSDGGTHFNSEAAVARGKQMVAEGVDVIDVGGESTRPGADAVSLQEELHRVIPTVRRLAKAVAVPISIDTTKAEVALRAIDAGASIVNDVSALRGDSQMAGVVARSQAAVILMHRRGTPQTMQRSPRYHDVTNEVFAFLRDAAHNAQRVGIASSRILLDPGLGFGKTVRHNLTLMHQLDRFGALGYPIVIGPSRKSFIGATLNVPPEERLAGTLACVAYAYRCGVHLVRVHDVQPTVQLIQMWRAIESFDSSLDFARDSLTSCRARHSVRGRIPPPGHARGAPQADAARC